MEKARQDKQIRAKAPISSLHLPLCLTLKDNALILIRSQEYA